MEFEIRINFLEELIYGDESRCNVGSDSFKDFTQEYSSQLLLNEEMAKQYFRGFIMKREEIENIICLGKV
jgi:hypothetical protein